MPKVISTLPKQTVVLTAHLLSSYLRDPFFDWHYTTQKSGWDAGQFIPRGKGMGGCSAVNALHFTRGNRGDFDNWAALGNKGWGYADVLPYFKKSENIRDPTVAADTQYHSTGGPLVRTAAWQAHHDNPLPLT